MQRLSTNRLRSAAYFLALALILTGGTLARFHFTDFDRQIVAGDETTYHNAALTILERGTIVRDPTPHDGPSQAEPTAALAPGYPVFLAVVYYLFGASSIVAFTAHAWLSAGTMALVPLTARAVGASRFAVIVATACAAVYPGFLYNNDRLLTEPLFIFLLGLFAWHFVLYMKRPRLLTLLGAGLALGAATQVRSLALPLLVPCMFIVLAFATAAPLKQRVAHSIAFCLGIAAMLAPFLVYNIVTFGRFGILPTGADGPAIWGAVPYFLDMPATSNASLSDVIQTNSAAAPEVYWRWRVFGYLQYMLGDVWDERLVHPIVVLKPFLLLQHFVVVPVLLLTPLIAWRTPISALFIAGLPVAFLAMNAPFHGLPRYFYPAIPFVFVSLAVLLTRYPVERMPTGILRNFEYLIRAAFAAVSVVLTAAAFYSVYLFAFSMEDEVSDYRLARYMSTDRFQVERGLPVSHLRLTADQLAPANVQKLPEDGHYRIIDHGPAVIDITSPPLQAEEVSPIVTKVTVASSGGFLFDNIVVYWTNDNEEPSFAEHRSYRVPTNWLDTVQTFYIDGDVTDLKIIPARVAEAEFRMDYVEVSKFQLMDHLDAQIN